MFIVLPPCLPRWIATRLGGMQQQEIPGALSSSRECRRPSFVQRQYTAIPQAKITMVRPIRARRKERGIPLMLLNKLGGAAANAGETPAMVPAEVLADHWARHHSRRLRRGYVTSPAPCPRAIDQALPLICGARCASQNHRYY